MNPVIKLYTHFRELASRGAFVFLANILEKATFFFLFVLFARSLPTEYFGIITTSFAVANIVSAIFEGGFNFYMQRAVAAADEAIVEQANQIFSLRVYLAAPYVLFCYIYLILYADQLPLLSGIIVLAVGLFSFNNLFNAIYFGLHRYKTAFILLSISRTILVAVFILFRAARMSVELITLSFLLSGLIHFLLLIITLRKDKFRLKLTKIRLVTVKKILLSSLPMGIGVILVWIYDRADTLLIQNILGYNAVAFYAVAYSLYKAPQAVANFILTPLFTEFSGLFAANGFINRNNFLKKLLILLTLSLMFSITLALGAKIIITFFYHAIYHQASDLLVLLVVALPGLILNNFTGTTLNAAKKEMVVTSTVLASALLNVVLNTVLLLHYRNLYAAVVVTIITEYLTFFFQLGAIVHYRILHRRIA
jgi:O-antigen/teichoic acid export membrane protein